MFNKYIYMTHKKDNINKIKLKKQVKCLRKH